MKRTVCDIVEDTLRITNDEDVVINLLEIKTKVTRMEDRLLKYCNAVEDLGFRRINRDYDSQ